MRYFQFWVLSVHPLTNAWVERCYAVAVYRVQAANQNLAFCAFGELVCHVLKALHMLSQFLQGNWVHMFVVVAVNAVLSEVFGAECTCLLWLCNKIVYRDYCRQLQ